MVRGNFPILLCVAALAAASFFAPNLRAQEFTIGPGDVNMTTRERAYTSLICNTPEG